MLPKGQTMTEIDLGAPPVGTATFDGLTGAPIRTAVDGHDAEVRFAPLQPPLVEVPIESLLADLRHAIDAVKDAKREKKAAAARLKDCQERVDEIADALCERAAPKQLPLAGD